VKQYEYENHAAGNSKVLIEYLSRIVEIPLECSADIMCPHKTKGQETK